MNFHPSAIREAFFYATSFYSNGGMAINTVETIVAPASNVAGLVVWRLAMMTAHGTAGSGNTVTCLAKSSAPASIGDGDVLGVVINYPQTTVGEAGTKMTWESPVFVAAGKGLYFRNGPVAEALASRFVLYSLLS